MPGIRTRPSLESTPRVRGGAPEYGSAQRGRGPDLRRSLPWLAAGVSDPVVLPYWVTWAFHGPYLIALAVGLIWLRRMRTATRETLPASPA